MCAEQQNASRNKIENLSVVCFTFKDCEGQMSNRAAAIAVTDLLMTNFSPTVN